MTAIGAVVPRLAPHQDEAANRIRSLLQERGGAVLADEPGLGKSWVAAALAREFAGQGFEIELTVPRALLRQWHDLLESFEVSASVLTHDALHRRFLVPGSGQSRLLVVDEAHRFRNRATNRYRALSLAAVGAHLLLVTATPFCNRLGDLFALVSLIAGDHDLADVGIPSIVQAFEQREPDDLVVILGTLLVRRGREVVPAALQFGELNRRVLRFRTADRERELREAIEKFRFPLIAAAEGQCALLRDFFIRRLHSGVAAFLESVRRQSRFYRRARESLAHGVSLTRSDYRRIYGWKDDEVVFQDLLFHDFWNDATADASAALPEIDRELASLELAASIAKSAVDQKVELLLRFLRDCTDSVLIFTSAVATARELFRSCSTVSTVGLISSRFCRANRFRDLTSDQVIDAFNRGEVRILVLTDVGAEGLNLQRAGTVIHYDLPWNPVRIEQRNGRVHRIGQLRTEVSAVYFLPAQESDRRVMRIVVAKNRVRRSVLTTSGRQQRGNVAWLRPRVGRADPQVAFLSRMQRDGIRDDGLVALLSERYRSGAEMLIRQMSTEYLDETRLTYLKDVLKRERAITNAS